MKKYLFIKVCITAIVSFLLTSLYSCTGGEPENGIIYEIDSISRSYCIFNKGDQWIYQLEGTNVFDTIVLTVAMSSETPPFNEVSEDGYESWGYKYESINMTESSLEGLGLVSPCISSFNPEISRATFNPLHGAITFINVFFGTDSVGKKLDDIHPGLGDIKLIETYDSLNINNNWYRDVLVFENRELSWNNAPVKLYWAFGIGRIKMETKNGEVWTLKEVNFK